MHAIIIEGTLKSLLLASIASSTCDRCNCVRLCKCARWWNALLPKRALALRCSCTDRCFVLTYRRIPGLLHRKLSQLQSQSFVVKVGCDVREWNFSRINFSHHLQKIPTTKIIINQKFYYISLFFVYSYLMLYIDTIRCWRLIRRFCFLS